MINIVGIHKSPYKLVLKIIKEEIVIDRLVELLRSLGFNSPESNKIRNLLGDSDNNYSAKKYSNDLYQDVWFEWKSDKHEIEVFFGDKRIFFVFRTKDQADIQKVISFLKI